MRATQLPHRLPIWSLILAGLVGFSGCNCGDSSYITQRTPPLINVANDLVEFAPIPVGFAVQRNLRILNAGGEALEVSLRVEGNAAFRLPAAAETISPAEDWEATIEFAPAEVGQLEATLVITSNDEQRPELRVDLRGEGIPNQICGACDDPPEDYCATESALVQHEEDGVCVDGECQYNISVRDCSLGCNDERGICFGDSVDAGTDGAGGTEPEEDAGTDTLVDAGATVVVDAGAFDGGPGDPLPACPAEAVQEEREVVLSCPTEQNLSSPGLYRLTIPAGCSELQVDLWGAGGGGGRGVSQGPASLAGGNGGGGAYVGATLGVSAGEVLRVYVGQGGAAGGCPDSASGGWPGGGRGGLSRGPGESGNGGGGGGQSKLIAGEQEVLVAGGGGGGGGHGWGSMFVAGAGGAGGPTGTDGEDMSRTNPAVCTDAVASGGSGGSAQGGGDGGGGDFPGGAGSLGQGGHGGDYSGDVGDPGGGGGGGGGTFGGGGGGATWQCNSSGSGGGGGASRGDLQEAGNGRFSGRDSESDYAGNGGRGGYAEADTARSGEAGRAGRARIVLSP